MHASYASHKWREGTDDRNKTGDDERFAAVFVEEFLCAFEILGFYETGILRTKDFGCEKITDPVIKSIAEDGRR